MCSFRMSDSVLELTEFREGGCQTQFAPISNNTGALTWSNGAFRNFQRTRSIP